MKPFTYLYLALSLSFFLSTASMAQESTEPNTIFDTDVVNGFGQFDIKYTLIQDEPVLLLGGQGGVILNRHVLVGLSAHATAYKVRLEGSSSDAQQYLNMGYSGLLLGYVIAPLKVVHISIPVTFGAGMANISNKLVNEAGNSSFYVDVENSLFLFAEPGLQLEINVTKFMKINLGVSYRLNHSLELESPLTSSDLNNWTGNFSIAIGKF